MREILQRYIPEAALDEVITLLKKYPCKLKIVNKRRTKHGDFRKLPNGLPQITINNDLNSYRFLLTLVHEIAHLVTFLENSHVKPHGNEWKRTFQRLMLPFLNPDIYPNELLSRLAIYFKNPKASTDTDVYLSLVLKQYDPPKSTSYIFEVPLAEKFVYNKRIFVRGEKRRTRYGCKELATGKLYLFHQNAEVKLIEN